MTKVHDPAREVDRFVGLSLGGSRSDRTALTVIDYYRKQQKAFVIDVYESIGAHDHFSADEVLLDIINELGPQLRTLATDAPLTLPPCLQGCIKDCKGTTTCKRPAVRWMRNQYKKTKARHAKLKNFAPYSQRPVDLYFRYLHLDQEIFQDETMGANCAPQAARMQYVKSHIGSRIELIEVWPKLALYYSRKVLNLTGNEVVSYRQLDDGVNIREDLVEELSDFSNIFIYERDAKKVVTSIPAFESFICAWVAMRHAQNGCIKFKKSLPLDTGWVAVPEF